MNKERTEKNISFDIENFNIEIDFTEIEELLKKIEESLNFNFEI